MEKSGNFLKKSGKFYYQNALASQNITAKTNIAWVADITKLELYRGQEAFVFLCVDIHTNVIVASNISKKQITAQQIVRSLNRAINKRYRFFGKKKLIIHTDRGTQFSSKTYYNFTEKHQDFFIPSMSRENTPTDNSVAERFMRTFKTHKIDDQTIEECLSIEMMMRRREFTQYLHYLNKYVKSLNNQPNKKSEISAKQHDRDVTAASLLMAEPKYSKSFSERIGNDFRLEHVNKFKYENKKVIGILEELAAKKAEVVENTPFDYENNIALKIIDKRITELYDLILSNPEVTKQYVQEALEPIEETLDEVSENVQDIKDVVVKEKKAGRHILPLRDPLNADLFPLFFTNAGSQSTYQKDLRRSQLRIAYTLLYYTGLRINEIRHITQKEIFDGIKASQLTIIHFKTKTSHIHVLSQTAVQNLKELKPEFEIVFNKYNYQYLFGKNQPIHPKTMVSIINKDLKHTSEINQIPFNIKSHSFRINMITNLLKVTTVQDAAQIIGHKDIQSTMTYKRYTLSKQEIQNLLDSINN